MSLDLATCGALVFNCTLLFNATALALLNYAALAQRCPPDRAFVNEQGGCTCRPGWRVGTAIQGLDTCIACDGGSYSATNDALLCIACEAGSWSKQASSDCTPCVANSYTSAPGASVCLPCPPDSSTSAEGGVDLTELHGGTRCFCTLGLEEVTDGSGANATMSCRPCPTGAECTSQQGVARAAQDHWFDEETERFFPCPHGFCCPSSNSSSGGCTTTDPTRCGPHREGFLCGVCESGYSSLSGRECIECPSINWGIVGALLAAGLVFILLCLFENPSEDASTKLIVDYLQMCVLILNPRLGVGEVLSIVHLDFGGTSAQLNACVMPLPPLLGVSAGALAPIGLFILLFIIYLIHLIVSHPRCCVSRLSSARGVRLQAFFDENAWRYTSAAWEITLFSLMAITSACVALLDCRSVGARYVVNLAPSEECFRGAHFVYAIASLALLCILTFVVPVWLVGHLAALSKSTQRRSSAFLHSMKQIKTLKEEYKRQKKKLHAQAQAQAASSGASGAVAAAASEAAVNKKLLDLDSYLARQVEPTRRVKRTGHEVVLWCYAADHYYSEAWFLLRRVLFTLVTVMLDRETAAMLVVWFCLVNLVAHARFPVFRKRSSSYYHDVCLGAIAFQAALNLDVFAADPQGHVNLDDTAARAQVAVVYGVALLPIVIGVTLFLKELLKERIRDRHTIVHKEEEEATGIPGPRSSISVRGGRSSTFAASPARSEEKKTNLRTSPHKKTPSNVSFAVDITGSASKATKLDASPRSSVLLPRLSPLVLPVASSPASGGASEPRSSPSPALATVASPSIMSPALTASLTTQPAATEAPAVTLPSGNTFRPMRVPRLHVYGSSSPALPPLPSPSQSTPSVAPSPLASPSGLARSPALRSFGNRTRNPVLASSPSRAADGNGIAEPASEIAMTARAPRIPTQQLQPQQTSQLQQSQQPQQQQQQQQQQSPPTPHHRTRPIDLHSVMASLGDDLSPSHPHAL